ncbi:MAG: hypothetical protein R8M14_02205 [Ghiorsea sp.]
MMNKIILGLLVLLLFSSCAMFHDGTGWEHDMNGDSKSIFEHDH